MKFQDRFLFISAVLFITLGISGCETDQGGSAGGGAVAITGNVKSQGVYTTLAINDAGLDMPAAGYIEKSSFGPGESPAAIIAGYGTYNQQQQVTLELTEADTGRPLLSRDYYASYGKVLMQRLSIRLSGNYKLRLTSNGADLDSWLFTVSRTNRLGAVQVDTTNSKTTYGLGDFSIDIGPDNGPDYFDSYDDKLIYSMLNAVTKEASSITNEDLFAQRFPGKVVIQCSLDFQGRLTDPKILEDSLDDDCSNMFLRALLGRSPYQPWPEDIHQKLGADHLPLTLTVNFE